MSQLYDDLAKLDRGIADRWKARSKDDPTHVLTQTDVEKIVFPLLEKDHKITEPQAEAIMTLIGTAEWTTPGLVELRIYVELASKYNFFEPGAVALVSTAELKPILAALGMDSVGRIIFKSPGSGISYAPHDYVAISRNITQKKVSVLEVRLHGLENFGLDTAGVYHSDKNTLFLYNEKTPAMRINTIVHESTHAVQDWRDGRLIHKHAEADAYIAGAVSDRSSGAGTQTKPGPIFDAAFTAAEFVMNSDADATNKPWLDAYKAVVQAVEKSPLYKSVKNAPMDNKNKETDDEKSQMAALVRAIDEERKMRVRYAPRRAMRTRHPSLGRHASE